jgi:hypothetical protein
MSGNDGNKSKFKGFTYPNGDEQAETQKIFYGRLAAELIDNTYDTCGNRRNQQQNAMVGPTICRVTGAPMCGIDIYLTPTKFKAMKKYGEETPYCRQGRC